MIDRVELFSSTYAEPPSRFEAGTPPIAEAVGFGVACQYLKKIGMDRIYHHEKELGNYLYQQLATIPDLTLYGPSPDVADRTGLVAFNHRSIHSMDMSFFLDQEGVAIRTGHHCTQPLHAKLGVAGSMRASLYFYNDKQEVDRFISILKSTIAMFSTLG